MKSAITSISALIGLTTTKEFNHEQERSLPKELRTMQKSANSKLTELKESSDGAWEELKAGMDGAWNSLGNSLKSATSRFK